MKKRLGKIACLPQDAQDLINNMFNEGATYAAISARLAALGHQVGRSLLTRWYASGYQDWIYRQQLLLGLKLCLCIPMTGKTASDAQPSGGAVQPKPKPIPTPDSTPHALTPEILRLIEEKLNLM